MIESQYIDLFVKYREMIDGNSVPVLNAQRDKALEVFKQKGFPTNKLEDYKYSDIAGLFAPDYGLNLQRVPIKTNPYQSYKCNVHELSLNTYFHLNDVFFNENLPQTTYPKGVFVGSLKEFAAEYPEVCSKYYGQIAKIENNSVAAFNTMFAQDGFIVYVPEKTVVEQPIQLINILTANIDYMANRRILVIAEKKAQVKILACDHTVDTQKFLATQVTEIFAGQDAHIEFYELEENSQNTTRIASTYVNQEKSSTVVVNNLTLHSGFTRNNYYVTLNGEYAEGTVGGAVIGGKDQTIDNFVYLDHAKPNCHSTQLFKYILQENSIGAFCGRIYVAPDAQKTQAYQTNNNLCMSPDAHMYSKPQLEIWADDVKCSHGLTTGQLDEEALFYMRSRGIAKPAAELLLMQAFASDVLKLIHISALRHRLEKLVEKRLSGQDARCGDCGINK